MFIYLIDMYVGMPLYWLQCIVNLLQLIDNHGALRVAVVVHPTIIVQLLLYAVNNRRACVNYYFFSLPFWFEYTIEIQFWLTNFHGVVYCHD